MKESESYLAILDEEQEKCARDDMLIVGEARLGSPPASVRAQVNALNDLLRLKRMVRCAATASAWPEILETS